MPTKSKSTFDQNIQRARYFLDIHENTQQGAGAPTLARRELPRGSIVFAVGALDAYLADISAEAIIARLLRAEADSGQRQVLKAIQKEVPTLSLEIALLETRDERVKRMQDAIVDYFQNQTSNHGPRAVASTLERIGKKSEDFWNGLSAEGHSGAAADLEKWTKVRHEIVHQGKKSRVTRPQAREFLDMVACLVAQVDSLVEQYKNANE